MKHKLKKLTSLAVVLCVGQAMLNEVQAQEKKQQWDEGAPMSTSVVVEKNKVLELPEASRNFEKFRVDPPAPTKEDVRYRFTDYKMPGQNVEVNMRVLTIKQEELSKLYGNYVKLGFGNYTTPYLKGYFHNKRNKDLNLGASVSHISSANGPVENSGVSNSSVGAYAEAYNRNLTVGGKLRYHHDRYNFYGYSDAIENVDEDTIQQVFNRVGAEIYLHNQLNERSKLQYLAALNFNYLKDNFEASEMNIGVNLNTDYLLNKDSKINVKTAFSAVSHEDDTLSNSRTYFKITPTYQRDMGKLDIAVGATIAYSGDTINDARQFNLYPALRASYEVVENKLVVFGGLEGDLQRVTLYGLVEENPFLAPNQILSDVNKMLDINGGLSMNLGNNVHLLGKVSFWNFRNLYFFNNSFADSAKFDVIYDRESTSAVNLFADVSYNHADKLRLGVKLDYTNYNTDQLARPYHRPSMFATLYGTYNLYDKIFFNAELYYISSSYGLISRPAADSSYVGVEVETDNIVDLNLKVDYRFSEKFSAFLMFNNVLGNKYERFVNYPNKGINVIGGITYSF